MPHWRLEPFFFLLKSVAGPNHVFFSVHQNSVMGGAELRTMKWLQGWSRFGSTFFLGREAGDKKMRSLLLG